MMRTTALLAVLLLAACAHLEPEAQHAPGDREGYFAGADSVHLYYRTAGAGSDTVVVVHGQQGNTLEYLAPDLKPLAEGRVLLF